jgi:hypothetical protein
MGDNGDTISAHTNKYLTVYQGRRCGEGCYKELITRGFNF